MSGRQDFGSQFIKRNPALQASRVRREFLKVDIKCCQYHRRAVIGVRIRDTGVHKDVRVTRTRIRHVPWVGPTLRRIKILAMDATGPTLWILEHTAPITYCGTPIAVFIAIHTLGAKFDDNRPHFIGAQCHPIATTGTTIRTVITR